VEIREIGGQKKWRQPLKNICGHQRTSVEENKSADAR